MKDLTRLARFRACLPDRDPDEGDEWYRARIIDALLDQDEVRDILDLLNSEPLLQGNHAAV